MDPDQAPLLSFVRHTITVLNFHKGSERTEHSQEYFVNLLRESTSSRILNAGQYIVFKDSNMIYQATIEKLEFIDDAVSNIDGISCGFFEEQTAFSFQIHSKDKDKVLVQDENMETREIFDGEMNFEKLGIGGMDTEAEQIFRKAFNSRRYPPAILKRYGIKHCKGMLLYGPPGTGKTLIARKIADALKCRKPKLVSGPEIFDKYVGGSEEKMRALFAEAEAEEQEKGEDSDLHIIIFDEIDAICKTRGTHNSGTGV